MTEKCPTCGHELEERSYTFGMATKGLPDLRQKAVRKLKPRYFHCFNCKRTKRLNLYNRFYFYFPTTDEWWTYLVDGWHLLTNLPEKVTFT